VAVEIELSPINGPQDDAKLGSATRGEVTYILDAVIKIDFEKPTPLLNAHLIARQNAIIDGLGFCNPERARRTKQQNRRQALGSTDVGIPAHDIAPLSCWKGQ
jgi:hypothetical protein